MPLLVAIIVAQGAAIAWSWVNGRVPFTVASSAPLTVTSSPTGSAVAIDGVDRGTTPLTLDLEPGVHQLQVGTELDVWTQALTVKAGAPSSVHVVQAASVSSTPAVTELGTLEVSTDPAGLAVAVDGVPRGVSPISIRDLAPGTHEVAVTRGTNVVTRAVSVEAGVPTAVLITTASAGIQSGWLTVSAPVPVQIQEDGVLVGSSETPRLLLPVGRHDLTLRSDAFGYQVRRSVQILAGRSASIQLEPVNGTLSVNAQPWAEVWIDGRRVGDTPIGNLSLPIGSHELVLRHPQLGERRRTVAVRVDAPTRVGIDLRQ